MGTVSPIMEHPETEVGLGGCGYILGYLNRSRPVVKDLGCRGIGRAEGFLFGVWSHSADGR